MEISILNILCSTAFGHNLAMTDQRLAMTLNIEVILTFDKIKAFSSVSGDKNFFCSTI